MWSPVQTIGRVIEDDFENCEEAPNSRSKHAMCTTPDGHIYLMGGRSGNRPLKDLWRLDPGQNTWEEVKCWGDQPPNLQEHTIIPWKDKLFVFGGEVGFSSSTETPLWILDLGKPTFNIKSNHDMFPSQDTTISKNTVYHYTTFLMIAQGGGSNQNEGSEIRYQILSDFEC